MTKVQALRMFLSESGSRVDHLFWEQVHAGSNPVFPKENFIKM